MSTAVPQLRQCLAGGRSTSDQFSGLRVDEKKPEQGPAFARKDETPPGRPEARAAERRIARDHVGAVLAVVSYSSLAIVLLTATLAASGVLPPDVGARPGVRRQPRQRPAGHADHGPLGLEVRQVPLGNLVFKLLGVTVAAPWACGCAMWRRISAETTTMVVLFHLVFNVAVGLVFIGWTQVVARWVEKFLPRPVKGATAGAGRTTWTRRPWPRPRWPSPARRARRCTRPTWSRPCCSACWR